MAGRIHRVDPRRVAKATKSLHRLALSLVEGLFHQGSINGLRFSGAVRDTVLVPAKGTVAIAFDANNPGRWAFHCHNLYHMTAGMMTEIRYVG